MNGLHVNPGVVGWIIQPVSAATLEKLERRKPIDVNPVYALAGCADRFRHQGLPDRAQGAPVAPCPDIDFLGALLVYCPLGRNPSDCLGRLPR